jgi:hypothetical protein
MLIATFLFKPLRIFSLLALGWSGLAAQAQTFKMECEVEGLVPQQANKRLAPAKVTLELQRIGVHMYFNVIGPADYQMRVSSLVTEQYLGTNLSSNESLGARKIHRASGRENQVLIDRQSVSYSGHNDVEQQGKTVRIHYEGKCKLPTP